MSFFYTAFGEKIMIENFNNTEKPSANTETPPVNTETPPVNTETPPVNTETPPVNTETPPVNTETPFADNLSNKNKSEVNYDFNTYSHIRLYSKDNKSYLTLYPKYLPESDKNSFALATSRDDIDKVLKNTSGNLLKNLVNFVDENENINDEVLVFTKVNDEIVKTDDIKLKLYYDFEKTSLSLTTDDKKNNLIGIDFSKTNTTTLHVYDHPSSSLFYKINKNRDTFYLSRKPDLSTLIRVGSCDIKNNLDSDENSEEKPTEFAFKPIMLESEKNKKPQIKLSGNLEEKLKEILKQEIGKETIDIDILTKIREAEFDNKKETLNGDEIKLLNAKNKLSGNLLSELNNVISLNISIRDSYRYYLVEVKTENNKRKSSKIKLEEDNIRGGYDFIITSSDDQKVKHLKVWVKE